MGFSLVFSLGVTLVIYVEGTIYLHGGKEIRIYVHKKYWDKLKPLIGKKVRILIIEEIE